LHGRIPSNKLSVEERQKVISIASSTEFRDIPPHQIVPKLADRGEYIASESSFYRILKEEKLDAHRGKSKKPNQRKPEAYIAKKPNEIWTWDITYLARDIKGMFFYLYLIIDIFSRKIVGFEVHERESAEHAATLAKSAYIAEQINNKDIVLHSDNGSPMKGATMLSMLQALGITPSFSRPSVSNDNPYSESMFKTLKYCPQYPSKPFSDIESARKWVSIFVKWYNEEHQHSSIKFVTPTERHIGLDKSILIKRKIVYEAAKLNNPSRWSKNTRNWDYIPEVYLNPGKSLDKAA
jgi:transposase InsO family protein